MTTKFAARMLPLPLLAAAAALLLLAGTACGGAGEPAAPSAETTAPATTAPQTAGGAVATAVPSPTEAPATQMESGDIEKFTVMVTTQGNELFNSKYAAGENNLWHRMAQVWLVGGSLQDGSLVLDPATGIASKWEIVDDGLAWEFTIRPGIQFHNGEELDVNDVAFMANWAITEEAAGVSTVRIAREITNREVTGPDTFKYTFKEPLAFFGAAVSEVDNTAIGTVISTDYWSSLPLGQTIENCSPVEVCQQAEAFEENPDPGLPGPFKVMSHRYEEEILYERFEDYFLRQERPYPFQSLSLRVVPELSTRVAALQAGEVDIIEADNTVVGQIQDSGGRIVYAPESVHIWINANGCDRETDNDGRPIMCHDLRVRQALDYAIDKTKIQALYGGSNAFEINGMHGIGSPSGLGFEPDLGPLPYDPDKAQQLLAESGYDGTPVTLSIDAGKGEHELIAVRVQSHLAEIGMDVEIEVLTAAVFAERKAGKQLQMFVDEALAWIDDPNYLLSLLLQSGVFGNYTDYNNARVDEIIRDGWAEKDPAARRAMFEEAQRIISEDAPWAFLAQPDYKIALRDNIGGYALYPNEIPRLADLYPLD